MLNLASLALYLQKAGDGAAASRPASTRRSAAPRPTRRCSTGRRWSTPWPVATDAALAALGRAIELGYSRADAANDDEFQALRKDARFAALVRG